MGFCRCISFCHIFFGTVLTGFRRSRCFIGRTDLHTSVAALLLLILIRSILILTFRLCLGRRFFFRRFFRRSRLFCFLLFLFLYFILSSLFFRLRFYFFCRCVFLRLFSAAAFLFFFRRSFGLCLGSCFRCRSFRSFSSLFFYLRRCHLSNCFDRSLFLRSFLLSGGSLLLGSRFLRSCGLLFFLCRRLNLFTYRSRLFLLLFGLIFFLCRSFFRTLCRRFLSRLFIRCGSTCSLLLLCSKKSCQFTLAHRCGLISAYKIKSCCDSRKILFTL